MATAVAVIGLGVAIFGAVSSADASRKSANAQTEQAKQNNLARAEQRKQAKLENLQRRRGLARNALAERARIVQGGANAGGGVGNISSVTSAAGSTATRGGVNISFLDTSGQLNQNAFNFSQTAANFGSIANQEQARSTAFASLGEFGQTAFAAAGGLGALGVDVGG